MDLFFLLVLAVPIVVIVIAIVNAALRPSSAGKPKGFPWILLFFGIVVVAGIMTLLLMGFGRQQLVIEVRGPPGAEIFGQVIVDGKVHSLNGTAPTEFEFAGSSFEAIVLAKEPNPDDPLVVFTGGSFDGLGSVDAYGLRITASKRFLSSSAGWNFVSPEEWEQWAERLRPMEAQAPGDLLPGPAAPSNVPQDAAKDEPGAQEPETPQPDETN